MKQARSWMRKLINIVLVLFIGMNALAAIHAWKFTHYSASGAKRTTDETKLTLAEKLSAMTFGVRIPKPVNDRIPRGPFATIRTGETNGLEAWFLRAEKPIGTVLIFHGYGGCRSGMLAKAERIRKLGYNCLLPDFSGSGGSSGNSCTIGYREADEVKIWYEYLRSQDSGNVFLMGQSMGAVAIMKAMHDAPMDVRGLILECPYGSMLRTVQNRFGNVGVPAFPMAQLLVFWGGALHGFNAFSLNPGSYAKSLRVPVLLVHGTKDPKVSEEETAAIFGNLAGPKKRLEIKGAAHNDYLEIDGAGWEAAMVAFLEESEQVRK